MDTENADPRFRDLDRWPGQAVLAALFETQLAAAAAVGPAVPALVPAVEEAVARLKARESRLAFAGCGASGRLAVQDGVELTPTYGWPSDRLIYLLAGGEAALKQSIEGAEDDAAAAEAEVERHRLGANDVLVCVAASGNTPYTVAACRAAAMAGALTVALASNPAALLLQAARHPVLLPTGSEIVAGSTRMKAGTAQKIALNLFSTAVMVGLGRVYRGRMVGMQPTNAKLKRRAARMVAELAAIDETRAAALLGEAGNDIRLAVLMATGLHLEQARARLDAAGGDLDKALG